MGYHLIKNPTLCTGLCKDLMQLSDVGARLSPHGKNFTYDRKVCMDNRIAKDLC